MKARNARFVFIPFSSHAGFMVEIQKQGSKMCLKKTEHLKPSQYHTLFHENWGK
jgi:hypothetical protein